MCCLVIFHEVDANDFPGITYQILRLMMNKSILYAGLPLMSGFSGHEVFLGMAQVGLLLLSFVSQGVTNRRIANQIQNNCTSSSMYAKHVIFCAAVLGISSTVVKFCILRGLTSFGLICVLDSASIAVLSVKGLSTYTIKALAVVINTKIFVRKNKTVSLLRRPTAEAVFCTDIGSLVDTALELCYHSLSALQYSVLYIYRDGLFFHFYDIVVLLDLRYLLLHAKRCLRGYKVLHEKLQHVKNALPNKVAASGDILLCPICFEELKIGKVLQCGHIYHLECLLNWLKECGLNACSCPICRSDLVTGVPCTPSQDMQTSDQCWADVEDLMLQDLLAGSDG